MSADATQVTGSPLAAPGAPRPGTVLAERYELLEVIDSDGLAIGFRALDQESERQVLVRILAAPGVHTRVCDEIVERLRGLVGIGGRYLASLLDADREGRCPFTVEPWPRGTPLSAILDSRRSRGQALGPREALPVIAQLAAALAALPRGLHHGDVRAERVWLDTDGLRLTGPFLLAALPDDELADRIRALGPGAVAYPPEARGGLTGTASDLWGVGSIAWEALTGRSPDPSSPAPEIEGDLRQALVALLAEAPEERPPNLDAIARAVARHAELSVPSFDPEPHQPPTALVDELDVEGTEPSLGSFEGPRVDPDSLDPNLVRAALGTDTERPRPPVPRPTPGPMDTAKYEPVSKESAQDMTDSLDPRLVRAALGISLEAPSNEVELEATEALPPKPPKKPQDSEDALDPRLVRAALGVQMDASVEHELLSDEIEAVEDAPSVDEPAKSNAPIESRPAAVRPPGAPPAPPKPGVPAPPGKPDARKANPQPPTPPSARPGPAPATPRTPASSQKAPPAPAGAGPRAPQKPVPKSATSSAAPQPAASPAQPQKPKPAASPVLQKPAAGPTPARASRSRSAPDRPQPAQPQGAQPQGASMSGFEPDEAGTQIAPRNRRVVASAASKRNRATGFVIVAVALLIAVAIVGVGFLIAGQRRADAARERELDQRIQELRREGGRIQE